MISKLWRLLIRPSSIAMGTILVVGFVAGIIFWGGFNWSLELTNTEAFCISCHEMEDNVYKEYQDTIHYSNRSGVRATCPDCHVPKKWEHKVVRKIRATNELFHKFLGTLDTREKFLDKRLELAQHEWDRMKQNDSLECRNCHDYTSMDYDEQARSSARKHKSGFEQGKTCIDCHKGIAHELPDEYEEEDDEDEDEDEDYSYLIVVSRHFC